MHITTYNQKLNAVNAAVHNSSIVLEMVVHRVILSYLIVQSATEMEHRLNVNTVNLSLRMVSLNHIN